MIKKLLITLLMFLVAMAAPAFARSQPPKLYIDKGACPFEGCIYRDWVTTQAVTLYTEKNVHSRVVAFIKANQKVTALTGDVHTIPGIIRLKSEHAGNPAQNSNQVTTFPANSVIYVYTYSGEGVYKVWYKGAFHYCGLYDWREPARDSLSGKWLRIPHSVWWVRIKTANGKLGWTNRTECFDGKDSLG